MGVAGSLKAVIRFLRPDVALVCLAILANGIFERDRGIEVLKSSARDEDGAGGLAWVAGALRRVEPALRGLLTGRQPTRPELSTLRRL